MTVMENQNNSGYVFQAKRENREIITGFSLSVACLYFTFSEI